MDQAISTGLFTIGGAIAGAVITAYASWQIARKKDLKRLTIFESKLTQLIGVESSIKDKLEIFYDKTPIDCLYQGTFYVINTGNTCVEDIQIKLTPQDKSKILDPKIVNSNFAYENDFITIIDDEETKSINIEYLNKSESCQFSYKVIDGEKKAKIHFRKNGVEGVLNQVSLASSPDIFQEAIEEIFEKTPWYILVTFKLFKKLIVK